MWLLVSGTAVVFIWRGRLVPHRDHAWFDGRGFDRRADPAIAKFRRRPASIRHRVGDLVEVAGLRGRVVVGALSTTLMLHDETAGSWL